MTAISLISRFDALLSDLDGVVYAGPHAIPGAVESLQQLAGVGVGLGYVTNNASRSPAQVAAHLRELGAPAEDEQVVSSSQAAADLLASLPGAGLAGPHHGKPGAGPRNRARGPRARATARTRNPVAVVQGFNPGIGWKDLAEAAYVVAAGALWVATNTDMSIPQARGIAPGNGTLVAAVAAATGQTPLVAGKPEAPLFHSAAKRLGRRTPAGGGRPAGHRHPRRQQRRLCHRGRPDRRRHPGNHPGRPRRRTPGLHHQRPGRTCTARTRR